MLGQGESVQPPDQPQQANRLLRGQFRLTAVDRKTPLFAGAYCTVIARHAGAGGDRAVAPYSKSAIAFPALPGHAECHACGLSLYVPDTQDIGRYPDSNCSPGGVQGRRQAGATGGATEGMISASALNQQVRPDVRS